MMIFIPVRRLRSNCGGVTSWASRVKGAFRFHNLDDVSPSTVARVGRVLGHSVARDGGGMGKEGRDNGEREKEWEEEWAGGKQEEEEGN